MTMIVTNGNDAINAPALSARLATSDTTTIKSAVTAYLTIKRVILNWEWFVVAPTGAKGAGCYSHYDGVLQYWPYAGADRASALTRLHRLAGRPQFICQEGSGEATRTYLESTGVNGDFRFVETGFRNHNDGWWLRPSPTRELAREWLRRVLSRDGAQE